jgi:transcriptional regulator with XRE-family HTH domain
LAVKANITQTALSQIERGKRSGAETVKKIASGTTVTLNVQMYSASISVNCRKVPKDIYNFEGVGGSGISPSNVLLLVIMG